MDSGCRSGLVKFGSRKGGQSVSEYKSLENSLISYWNLDSLNEYSSSKTLTNNGTVTFINSNLEHSATFNGSNHLSISNQSSLHFAQSDFTIAFWCFPTSNTGYNTILAKDDVTTNREFNITLNNVDDGGKAVIGLYDGTAGGSYIYAKSNTFGTIPITTWSFVVCYHNSVDKTVSLQVNNGTIDTSSAYAFTPLTTGTQPLRIGLIIAAVPNSYLLGRLSRLGVWGRLLTPDEITKLYTRPPLYDPTGFFYQNL